jgi:2-amino-4-hydroxy-6-hydroxymethyldihydropteridine diphosphokinase
VSRAYLGIGSNLGDRLAHLQAAVDGLASVSGISVVAVSPVYATLPVGGPEQDEFLNAVVAVETRLSARALLGVAHDIEATEQRVRTERWGPRTLDVDILLVGDEEIHETDLEVPHPRMWERGFVMAPLHDIAPELAPTHAWTGVKRSDLSLRATKGPGPAPRTRGLDREG